MTFTCTARSALAVFLSFSLLSLTCEAQPLAEPRSESSTKPFREDLPAVPESPSSQPAERLGGQTPAARAAGTASLNFPPDRSDSVAMQCEQLAGQPLDALRIGDGVDFTKIQVDQALPVCEQAAARQPARPRYQYLYGRVLDAAKRYPAAVVQFVAADQAGYGFASFSLAAFYEDGSGVTKNWEEAARLYFRAGNAGIADAFAAGGELYLEENPPDYREAKSWLEQAVQHGSADGYSDLGWMYESGNGVSRDPAKALGLYNEAAKLGSGEGMYRIGMAYYDGLGVQKDPVAACQWFIRAAADEHPYAEGQAGLCYYNGTGVAQNHATAFDWFVKAGQAGLVDAEVFVADMLERGDGYNQDSTYAVKWYQAAAGQGDVYAMTELGAHLRLGKGIAWSEAQAMQWFAKAAQKGYPPAETSLAVGYENGLGQDSGQGRQDYQQAAYWFNQAANQDSGYAQLNLGLMYENGWGVPQNFERAKQLYARAAGSSNTAVANLGRQYFDGVPASAPSERAPRQSVASSAKDSSDFWAVVIVGALAVGVVAALSSGGSSDTSSSNYTGGGYNPGIISSTPSSPVSGNPPGWTGDTAPYNPHYTDSARMWKIPMGDLTDPNIAWH